MPSDDATGPVFTPMVTAEAALRMILDEICRDVDMYLAQFMESDDELGGAQDACRPAQTDDSA